jgi:glycerophosphoryl diester phosphodiesterase
MTTLSAMTERALRRVGHKGADLIAPGNTRESFDAALRAGVDMIEFDVVPQPPADWRSVSVAQAERRSYPDQPLLLAHDWSDASRRAPHTLDEGLEHLASEPFSGVELDVDLKLPGYEQRVLDALRRYGLVERTLISSQYRESLRLIRNGEPRVRLGWSVPKVRRDPFRSRLLVGPALVAVLGVRAALPRQAARAIRSGECDALMAHWRLITPALVRAVRRAGGELYVWTVDELPQIRALDALGVTGVITNDPRLFGALAEAG